MKNSGKVMDFHIFMQSYIYISLPIKVIHSINETVTITSQTIGVSITNFSMIKNSNEITTIN